MKKSILATEAFWQRSQRAKRGIGLPDNTTIFGDSDDDSLQRAAQGFHTVSGFQFGGFGQGLDNARHRIPRQHARNVMGDSGHDFTAAHGGQIGEDKINDCPANVGESVAIEEKKRSAAVA
jgi:hypothetical protein